MCEARRAEYVRLLDEEGMNFTQAAHAVGVSKRCLSSNKSACRHQLI